MNQTVLNWITGIIGGVIVVTVPFIGKWLYNVVRRLTEFLDDWTGAPARPGVAARPGVMARLSDGDDQRAAQNVAISEQNVILAEHTKTLGEAMVLLGGIAYELPKNGRPLADKVNELWNKYVADNLAADLDHAHDPQH